MKAVFTETDVICINTLCVDGEEEGVAAAGVFTPDSLLYSIIAFMSLLIKLLGEQTCFSGAVLRYILVIIYIDSGL